MDNQLICIIHIITKLELGGAQQNTLFTVEHLDRGNFKPVLISGEEGVLVPKAKALKGIKCILLPTLHRHLNPVWDVITFFYLVVILRQVRKKHPKTIVHTHSSKMGILGRWAAFAAGIRSIVHTVHGFGFHDHQKPLVRNVFIFLERITARITSQLIFVSQANFEQAIKLGICRKRGQGRLIRSGIDLKEFRRDQSTVIKKSFSDPACQQAGRQDPFAAKGEGFQPDKTFGDDYNQDQGGLKVKSTIPQYNFPVDYNLSQGPKGIIKNGFPLVGMIACFKPQKSPLDFIHMAAHVRHVMPKAQFVMVGDGELRLKIYQLAERLNLFDHLFLAGWREDIKDLLPEFDVLVLTSLWEGVPRVLVEATAAGIPIVATDIDGNREIVQNGVNGYLVPPHNPEAMAEKVLSLLQNQGQLSCSEEIRHSILDGFDIHHMVRQQEKMYLELCGLNGHLDHLN